MTPILIDLSPLYNHIARDHECKSLPLGTVEGRAFSKIIKGHFASVPKEAGLYTWFRAGVQRPIYVGKASAGKTCNLHARLLEETKEERGFLWAGELIGRSEEHLHAVWQSYYPDRPGSNKSRRHIERAIRKRNSTHLVIVPTPALDAESVLSIENHLIRILAPEVNAFTGSCRPEDSELAGEIAAMIQTEISRKT